MRRRSHGAMPAKPCSVNDYRPDSQHEHAAADPELARRHQYWIVNRNRRPWRIWQLKDAAHIVPAAGSGEWMRLNELPRCRQQVGAILNGDSLHAHRRRLNALDHPRPENAQEQQGDAYKFTN